MRKAGFKPPTVFNTYLREAVLIPEDTHIPLKEKKLRLKKIIDMDKRNPDSFIKAVDTREYTLGNEEIEWVRSIGKNKWELTHSMTKVVAVITKVTDKILLAEESAKVRLSWITVSNPKKGYQTRSLRDRAPLNVRFLDDQEHELDAYIKTARIGVACASTPYHQVWKMEGLELIVYERTAFIEIGPSKGQVEIC